MPELTPRRTLSPRTQTSSLRTPEPLEAAAPPEVSPGLIVAAATAGAAIFGRYLADGKTKYSLGLVLAAIYAPLVLFDLPGAVALWTAVLFVKDLHSLSVGPNAMGLLIGLGFLGTFLPRMRALPVLREQRHLIFAAIMLCLWLTLSAAWAEQPGRAANESAFWWLGAFAMLIILVTLVRARDIKLVMLAFVLGALVSAMIGLASGGLGTATAGSGGTVTTSLGQTALGGRLTGGGGDPNVQAAAYVAAMFICIGLIGIYRALLARLALLGALMVLTTAFFATESRGGLLALAIATILALIISPRQRGRILGLMAIVVAVAGIAIASTPGALQRITDVSGGTSGRSDIWAVAIKVFSDHPLVGVGTDNFEVVEPRFALLNRSVARVTYIAETPYREHNTYLGLLAENGLIGLFAFLALLTFSLRSAWRASTRFEMLGRRDYAQLARATLMGTVAMLAAMFFISNGDDWRLWILLGLGPALLALAHATEREAALKPGHGSP